MDVGDSELIFISGQIPKGSDGMVISDNIEKQTECVFERLSVILAEAGAAFEDVVKLNMYLVDMSEFEKVSAIRNKYVLNSQPAATTIGISATVSKGCRIEVDAIAVKKK